MIKKVVALGCLAGLYACGNSILSKKNAAHSSDNKSSNCLPNYPETCDTSIKIDKLTALKNSADQKNDYVHAAELQIKINYLTEISQIEANTSSALETELSDLRSKYDVLESIFSTEVEAYKDTGFVSQDDQIRLAHEGFLTGPKFTSSYHPLSLAEVKKVTKDFGSLYIRHHKKNENGISVYKSAISDIKPWSGFWYPVTSHTLYAGNNAPLRKWDQVLQNRGIDSKIADQEQKRYVGYMSEGWEGLCDGWSIAAATTPEPTQSKFVDGIEFSIADQKALHTYSHVKWDVKVYGIPYRGDSSTDGTYQDIRPEAFHRTLTYVIGHQKRSVVIDDTAGVQVWNKPLYRYSWTVEKDPHLSNAYLVKGFPWLVKERQEESNRLTENKDILAPKYTFRLYVDRSRLKNKRYKVVAGQWIGASYEDHPDTITYPLKDSTASSHNPEFNKYLQEYNDLLLNAQ